MTYGSLFSGVGGLDLGFELSGFRCAWQVECDKTANAVRRRHWPDVMCFDDVRHFPPKAKRKALIHLAHRLHSDTR